jgi:hypothetical protein
VLEQAHPIANVKMCTRKLQSPLMAGCRASEVRTLPVSADTAVDYAYVLGKIWRTVQGGGKRRAVTVSLGRQRMVSTARA